MKIREALSEDCRTVAALLRESSQDVAARFGLNAENCPKHTSFCTEAWVVADLARGERYFLAEVDGIPVACVAYEKPGGSLAYLNRLSVLPAYRCRGIGEALVRHVVDLARGDGLDTISIGVIGEHTDLQRWYTKLGFVSGEMKRFAHLPFSVRYMAYAVARDNAGTTGVCEGDIG